MVSIVILTIGLVALGALSISTSHGNQQSSALSFMVNRTQSHIESIKAAPTSTVASFHDTSVVVTDEALAAGVYLENGTISVDVDTSTPTLLVVTVTASWSVGTEPGSLTYLTEIYDPGA